LRRRISASAVNPVPNSPIVPGSGTAVACAVPNELSHDPLSSSDSSRFDSVPPNRNSSVSKSSEFRASSRQ
jgi:hypothetical protein